MVHVVNDIEISPERLIRRLDELAEIGAITGPRGHAGSSRLALTDDDRTLLGGVGVALGVALVAALGGVLLLGGAALGVLGGALVWRHSQLAQCLCDAADWKLYPGLLGQGRWPARWVRRDLHGGQHLPKGRPGGYLRLSG